MKKILTLFAVMALVWPLEALAQDYKTGDIKIEHAWARASAGKTAAAYLTIVNGGATEDRLVSAAASSISKKTGLHQSLMEDGIMKMRPAGTIALPPGGKVALKPGGYHVMFMGLKMPLKVGGSFPLTLVFEKAGEIEIMVPVKKAGAMEMQHTN